MKCDIITARKAAARFSVFVFVQVWFVCTCDDAHRPQAQRLVAFAGEVACERMGKEFQRRR